MVTNHNTPAERPHIDLSTRERFEVESARALLATIDGERIEDASSAAYMVGRLEVSLRSMVALVDGVADGGR